VAQTTILLAAGGTGGHVFPAIALAETLQERGYRVEFITDKRGKRFFDDKNFSVNVIASSAVPRSLFGRAIAALKILSGIVLSLYMLREYEPKVVVGFGGYPSFPPLFAAQVLKTPTIVHEQNAVFGRANRQVSRRVVKIATSFPETRSLDITHQEKVVYTGNPIRKVFSTTDNTYTLPQQNFNLLIFGGSQGASLFSKVIPEAIARLPMELQQRLTVTQQCRAEDMNEAIEAYKNTHVKTVLKSFFDDMLSLYQQAHLVIGRAGASTVAEITAMGRPSILIPLAVSLDGDQANNAEQMVKHKAAWMMAEKDFTPESLAARLTELMTNPAQLQAAAQASKELGVADAASKLADVVVAAIG
jgi:UDP-N-acetylglucosamine--N-acetylmuramyl-(pentapeptide) pyrophosphoryl-undecaprenol N-acetylglucosamine transferase